MFQQFIEVPENCTNVQNHVFNVSHIISVYTHQRLVHLELTRNSCSCGFETAKEALEWYNEIKSQLNLLNNPQNTF